MQHQATQSERNCSQLLKTITSPCGCSQHLGTAGLGYLQQAAMMNVLLVALYIITSQGRGVSSDALL